MFYDYVFSGPAPQSYVDFANLLCESGFSVAWINFKIRREVKFRVLSGVDLCDRLICFSDVNTDIKCNCLVFWEVGANFDYTNLEVADLYLCSSAYSRDLMHSRCPFTVTKALVMGSPIFKTFPGPFFKEYGSIGIITDDVVGFYDGESKGISFAYEGKYGKKPNFVFAGCNIVNNLDILRDCFSVVFVDPIPDECICVHEYCVSNGIPAFFPVNDIFHDSNFVYYNPEEMKDIVCMNDLTREQCSFRMVNSNPRVEASQYIGVFHNIISVAKKTSPRHIGFGHKLNDAMPLDSICLHCGTGIGDQLLLGSVIENFKLNNPDTNLCITVKNNDENSDNKGKIVFAELFGRSPFFDRVHFLNMNKTNDGYTIGQNELLNMGIDPNRIFSIDLVPSFLMGVESKVSALEEISSCLNIPVCYHQKFWLDEKSEEFGKENSNLAIFCVHGSKVHEGRNSLNMGQIRNMIQSFRKCDHFKGVPMACVGVGNYDEKELSEIFDKVFYNKTSIREDIALVKNSFITVSVDTGIAHVAMNLGVPFLGIFHEMNFDVWVADYYKKSDSCCFLVCEGENLSKIDTTFASDVATKLFAAKLKIKSCTVLLFGGRSDQLLAEPTIRSLSKSYDQITLVTSQPYLWFGHPNLHNIIYSKSAPRSKMYETHFNGDIIDLTDVMDRTMGIHAIDAYAVRAGVTLTDRIPNVIISKDNVMWAKNLAEKIGKPFVAIHAVSSNVNKMWFRNDPKGCWEELIVRIKSLGYEVVHLGATVDFELDGCLNIFCDKYSEGKQMALLNKSKALVSIDGFMAHVAAAANIPSIVIWGSTSPLIYGHDKALHINHHHNYDCAPCNRPMQNTMDYSWNFYSQNWQPWQCPHRSCLKSISVNEVFSVLKKLLEKD